MKRLATLLSMMILLAGMFGWAAAEIAVPGNVHRGTGTVTAVSPARIVLEEVHGRHAMALDGKTRIVIDQEARVGRLGTGDVVAEECVPDGKGGVQGRQADPLASRMDGEREPGELSVVAADPPTVRQAVD
jgi:hypothetical protein